jgi:uncharacterized membrane protein
MAMSMPFHVVPRHMRQVLKDALRERKNAVEESLRRQREARKVAFDALPFAIYAGTREVGRCASENAARAAVAEMQRTRVSWKRYWYAARNVPTALATQE